MFNLIEIIKDAFLFLTFCYIEEVVEIFWNEAPLPLSGLTFKHVIQTPSLPSVTVTGLLFRPTVGW